MLDAAALPTSREAWPGVGAPSGACGGGRERETTRPSCPRAGVCLRRDQLLCHFVFFCNIFGLFSAASMLLGDSRAVQSVMLLGGSVVRALDSGPRGREFDCRQLRFRVTRSTQLSIPLGQVNRVLACMAGVKAGRAHLCRVAGNTVIPYGR